MDRAANLAEQMRNQGLGLGPTTGREELPVDQLRNAVNMVLDTIEDDTRLDATLEALQHLRPPSAGPDSSGDEDVRGYTRRNRITSREKKELVLLAANICHVELQARGKDKFWKSIVDKYQEQGGRKIVWSTAKSFFLKETRQRIEEK